MPRLRASLAAVPTALAALALAGCVEASGPTLRERVFGVWELETVNGQALPFRTADRSGDGCDIEVTSSQLILRTPGIALSRMHNASRVFPRGGTAPACALDQTFTDEHPVVWSLSGETISVALLFVWTRETHAARLDGDRLVLTYANGYRLPDGEYRYRKTAAQGLSIAP